MAQKANILELPLNMNESTTKLNEEMSDRFMFSVAFDINMKRDCIKMILYPHTFASAIFARCALQSADFNLYGTKNQPVIGRRSSTHKWPSRSQRKNCQICDYLDGDVIDQLRKSDQIVVYIGDGCPIIFNPSFQNLLKSPEFLSLFEIGKVDLYPNYMLKAKGQDSDDWDENREREIDRLLSDREDEIIRSREEAYYEAIARKQEAVNSGLDNFSSLSLGNDILLVHYKSLNKGDFGLDDAVKDSFGQTKQNFFYQIEQQESIQLNLFFENGIPQIISDTTIFPLKLGDKIYVNDSCSLHEADELILEDENLNSISEPKIMVCLESPVEISLPSIVHQLLRAQQCSAIVTITNKSRQCRNKSRRFYNGECLCHYHKK